jgi:putative DNA primase/helicase
MSGFNLNTTDDTEIKRLAALPLGEYEKRRAAAAQQLGYRAGILDKAVDAARRQIRPESGQGSPLTLPEPELWPDPVDAAALLSDISFAILRHVVMSPAAADAVATWVLHTYTLDAAPTAPRLRIKSPEKRCGKTTLLSTISYLVMRPLLASNISPAALFRVIEATKPTMLIDEADTFAANSDDLRCIVNSGHTRSAAYVVRTVGEDFTPRKFSTWSAMAIAAIGKLPATIEDRSISINLRRRRPEERIERLGPERIADLQQMARRAASWAADCMIELASADPQIPDALHDRAADNWRPLLAIADVAGGDWPARARSAALELSNDTSDQDSVGTLLLHDIRSAFESKSVDRISGDELTTYLVNLDDRPWPEFKSGRPLTKATLARQLSRYKILSGTIRLPDGRTLRGYYLSSFTDAFARYLSLQTATPPQLSTNGHCGASQTVTAEKLVALSKASQSNNDEHCGSVTFQGGNGRLCAHCRKPETDADAFQLVGIDGHTVLLHRRCIDNYATSDIPPFIDRRVRLGSPT